MILFNISVLVLPYCFVQFFFFDNVLFKDKSVAQASAYTQQLFALTVALCVHSHTLILADVLDMFDRDPSLSVRLLGLDVAALLCLLIVVFPTAIFFHMTRTITKWRCTSTVILMVCFCLTSWKLGSLFPPTTSKKDGLFNLNESWGVRARTDNDFPETEC